VSEDTGGYRDLRSGSGMSRGLPPLCKVRTRMGHPMARADRAGQVAERLYSPKRENLAEGLRSLRKAGGGEG